MGRRPGSRSPGCRDCSESTGRREHGEDQIAIAAGRDLEIDRIGTALLNDAITQDEARRRLLANGSTENEAEFQLARWRETPISFATAAEMIRAEHADI